MSAARREASVLIAAGEAALVRILKLPLQPGRAVVPFHGSGAGRRSLRNRFVAARLCQPGPAMRPLTES